ncbi:hypothetical protein [Saccharothrix xinjiangensis]|uniref:Uncharacterized protein n=1 Tax=Saccharothrix xinjiangensis TaxID=204798 RepID=A0ABV9YBI0_9PSEU
MTDASPQDPDPDNMILFCRELLPEILVKACLVKPSEAAAVGEDVLARATAFAALPQQTQDVLVVPFAEEVFDHEPTTAPLDMLAATTVVVRNSRLEHSHFSGLVEPGTLRIITKTALVLQRHLCEWVAASFVVAEAGLVLASSSPTRPGPDVLDTRRRTQDQVDQQTPDLG